MGVAKSKQRRIRSSSSAPISTSHTYSLYHPDPLPILTPTFNLNLDHIHDPNPPNLNGNVYDNLIHIVNIINNINNATLKSEEDANNTNNNAPTIPTLSEDSSISQHKKKYTTKDMFGDEVLIIDCDSFVIDENDQISRTTAHVIWRILSLLNMRELCSVQQVSHFWYCAGRENEVWKRMLLQDCTLWEGSSKGLVNTLKCSLLPVKWKKIAREECSLQQCWKCKHKFQKCRNSAIACMYHPQGRELIEDKIGAPSGVYWTCCLNRSKSSPGCVIGYHSEYEWAKDGKRNVRREGARVREHAETEGARAWRVSL